MGDRVHQTVWHRSTYCNGQGDCVEVADGVPGSVAYSEAPTSSTYSERPHEIARHEDAFDRLMASSVQPERSVAWLKEVAEEYSR